MFMLGITSMIPYRQTPNPWSLLASFSAWCCLMYADGAGNRIRLHHRPYGNTGRPLFRPHPRPPTCLEVCGASLAREARQQGLHQPVQKTSRLLAAALGGRLGCVRAVRSCGSRYGDGCGHRKPDGRPSFADGARCRRQGEAGLATRCVAANPSACCLFVLSDQTSHWERPSQGCGVSMVHDSCLEARFHVRLCSQILR